MLEEIGYILAFKLPSCSGLNIPWDDTGREGAHSQIPYYHNRDHQAVSIKSGWFSTNAYLLITEGSEVKPLRIPFWVFVRNYTHRNCKYARAIWQKILQEAWGANSLPMDISGYWQTYLLQKLW